MQNPSNALKTIHYHRVIDLSHSLDPTLPIWPGDPPFEVETVAEFPLQGYYLRRFSMGEHSGTHLNAPNSFYSEGEDVNAYTPESLIVSAIVINFCDQTSRDPDARLTISDILNWEKKHQPVPAKSIVLLYTGWQHKWQNTAEYLNVDSQGNLHFPGFAGEATQFLLEQRDIVGVGIDTHGVDGGFDQTFTTNKLVLKNSGLVLENLTHLDQLPATEITLVIGILRLKGGSGSPVSALAFF